MIKKSLGMLLITLMMVGCNAKQCIKLDGGYQDYKGGLEYCVDLTKSQAEARLIMSSSSIDKVWAISEAELTKLLDKTGIGDISIKTMEKLSVGVRLKEALK